MQVSKLLEGRARADIISCSADQTLRDIVRTLAARRIGAMPVVDGDEVVGIISERDVLYCLASADEGSLAKPVREVMTTPVTTVECTTSCDEALALMTAGRFRHLPVIENGAMCGFLSIGDLVKSRLDEVSHEAEAMRDYIRFA
ncbi:MAG TPA: CBS domain-containing protein [Qipengyuania sp.]|nr:CBS domain-containing protein [Qipengyuania sp.]